MEDIFPRQICAHTHSEQLIIAILSTYSDASPPPRSHRNNGIRCVCVGDDVFVLAETVTLGRLKASSVTPTTRIKSSRAPPTRSATIATHIAAQACGFLASVHVYLGPHPRRALALIFFISNKQAVDYFAALGYQPHKQEFCHCRCVFFQQNRVTIGLACAQAVLLRGAPTTARRHVAAPRRPPPLHMAYNDHDRNVSHIHGFA